jgi:hypothetical protein
MTPQLRPMNLGEILDRSLHVYRRQFWAFAAVAAVPALVVQGISMADALWFHLYASSIRDNHWTPGLYMTRAVFAVGYYHFASFMGFLLFPVILRLASGIVFNGEIKIREGWRIFGTRWRSHLWLATLKLVAGLVAADILAIAVLAGEIALTEALHIDTGTGLKSLSMIVLPLASGFGVFLWASSSLSLAIPSAALENLKTFRALRRSWALTRGSRLRIALAWIALALASWMLSISFRWTLRLVFLAVVRSTHARWIAYTLYPILSHILNTALAALIGPIMPIALTLFYYDQRIRREGYDIEQMMAAAGLNPTATPPAADAPVASTVPEEGPA